MKLSHSIVLTGMTGLAAAPAAAASLDISIDIPRLSVAEYHRPYVAIWLEQPGNPQVRNLAVWYDVGLKNNEGTKWLRDLRTWWRKAGREVAMPADGLSSPTRAPGPQSIAIPAAKLAGLAPGDYELLIEAAREVGGREVVRVPINLGKPGTARAAGTTELGAVSVVVKR